MLLKLFMFLAVGVAIYLADTVSFEAKLPKQDCLGDKHCFDYHK